MARELGKMQPQSALDFLDGSRSFALNSLAGCIVSGHWELKLKFGFTTWDGYAPTCVLLANMMWFVAPQGVGLPSLSRLPSCLLPVVLKNLAKLSDAT